jgi:hypothetical protein
MMTAESSLQALPAFLEATPPPSLNLVLAAVAPDNQLTLRRPNLSEQVASSFRDIPKGALKQLKDTILRQFQPGYKPDEYEMLYVKISDFENIRSTIDALSSIDSLALLGDGDLMTENLVFSVFALQDSSGKQAFFFQRTTSQLELIRKYPWAILFDKGTFNKVEQKVLLFDDEIDCFSWDGFLYIRNVNQFQRIFDFFNQLRTRASATIDSFVARIPISNEDDFRKACLGHPQMLAKLASISTRSYVATLSMDKIRRTIDEYGLAVTTEKDENGREWLVFERQLNRRWLILKLLDDDYLHSGMTDIKYETNSKLTL